MEGDGEMNSPVLMECIIASIVTSSVRLMLHRSHWVFFGFVGVGGVGLGVGGTVEAVVSVVGSVESVEVGC